MTDKEKNLDYAAFETMLSAPMALRRNNEEEYGVLGNSIPDEEIAGFIAEIGLGGILS
ncbi:MAG: hypothetical protein OXH59_19920 [Rhodospirillaceae bacterium]|nr:hypothetical protein [Rhodospirillaceae bacterium]